MSTQTMSDAEFDLLISKIKTANALLDRPISVVLRDPRVKVAMHELEMTFDAICASLVSKESKEED